MAATKAFHWIFHSSDWYLLLPPPLHAVPLVFWRLFFKYSIAAHPAMSSTADQKNESPFTDPPVKFKVGGSGKVYYVHPGVLLPFSSSALCTRIHGSWKGTNDDTVDLTDDDEHTIENVIDFFYKRKYHPVQLLSGLPMETDDDSLESPLEIDALEILAHARVLSFAHMYLISELESYATERLTKCLAGLEGYSIKMLPHLAEAIRVIYGTTPKISQNAARPLLSDFTALKFSTLAGALLDDLMAEFGDFRVDVLGRLAGRIEDMNLNIIKLEVQCAQLDEDLFESKEQVEGWETWNRSLPLSNQRPDYALYH